MDRAGTRMPVARDDELLVEELPDEILVYDLRRHRAYCLNRTAALVWRHCDGKTTVGQTATRLRRALAAPADERMVWMALDRLGKVRLLREPASPPTGAGYSRREVAQRLGLVGGLAILLPAITTLVAPLPAEAALSSCTLAQCRAGTLPGCGGCAGLPCSDRPGTRCGGPGTCNCR